MPGPQVIARGANKDWVIAQAGRYLKPIMLGWPYKTWAVLEYMVDEVQPTKKRLIYAGEVLFDGAKLAFSRKGPRQAAA
jgi:hypothetical protein